MLRLPAADFRQFHVAPGGLYLRILTAPEQGYAHAYLEAHEISLVKPAALDVVRIEALDEQLPCQAYAQSRHIPLFGKAEVTLECRYPCGIHSAQRRLLEGNGCLRHFLSYDGKRNVRRNDHGVRVQQLPESEHRRPVRLFSLFHLDAVLVANTLCVYQFQIACLPRLAPCRGKADEPVVHTVLRLQDFDGTAVMEQCVIVCAYVPYHLVACHRQTALRRRRFRFQVLAPCGVNSGELERLAYRYAVVGTTP